jgi:cobalt-zinc-cadmium efflux system protein
MHFHMHDHSARSGKTVSRLKLAAWLTVALVVFEIVAGFVANSLSLYSDAAHNVVDAMSLLLAWWGVRIAERPADKYRTFGYNRATVLIALFNAMILALVIIQIAIQGVERYLHPVAVDGTILGITGVVAIFANLGVALLLKSSSHQLHVRGAYLQNLADAAGSILLVVSGLIIRYTGAVWVDLILCAALCGVLVMSILPIFRSSVHILLEGSPEGVDADRVKEKLLALPEILQVHDLHLWVQGDEQAAMTCHVVIRKDVPHELDHALLDRIRDLLRDEFELHHTTIQLEHEDCEQSERCTWRGKEHTH